MKVIRIKQLQKLEKDFRADGYEFVADVKSPQNVLIITIKLQSGNDKKILERWNDARRIGG